MNLDFVVYKIIAIFLQTLAIFLFYYISKDCVSYRKNKGEITNKEKKWVYEKRIIICIALSAFWTITHYETNRLNWFLIFCIITIPPSLYGTAIGLEKYKRLSQNI
jgi:hypothetical protein